MQVLLQTSDETRMCERAGVVYRVQSDIRKCILTKSVVGSTTTRRIVRFNTILYYHKTIAVSVPFYVRRDVFLADPTPVSHFDL